MARVEFGGSFDFPTGASSVGPSLDPGTVWDAQTGGTQITDLLTMRGQPVDHLTTELCAPNGYVRFQGPDDGTDVVWVACSAPERVRMVGGGVLSGLTTVPNEGDPYFEFDKRIRGVLYFTTVGNAGEAGFSVSGSDGSAVDLSGVGMSVDPEDSTGSTERCSVRLFVKTWDGDSNVDVGYCEMSSDYIGGAKAMTFYDPAYFEAGINVVNGVVSVAGDDSGAALSARVVGGTATGAPASGDYLARDVVVTTDGHIWVCTAAGSPGTWRDLG